MNGLIKKLETVKAPYFKKGKKDSILKNRLCIPDGKIRENNYA